MNTQQPQLTTDARERATIRHALNELLKNTELSSVNKIAALQVLDKLTKIANQ